MADAAGTVPGTERDTPDHRELRAGLLRKLKKRPRWWEKTVELDAAEKEEVLGRVEAEEVVYKVDGAVLLEEVLAQMGVEAAHIASGTSPHPQTLPSIATTTLPGTLLTEVHAALSTVRANTPAAPRAAKNLDTYETLHHIIDPHLYSLREEVQPYGGNYECNLPTPVPTVYEEAAGVFTPRSYVNGVQLCGPAGCAAFDVAARGVLAAAYPLLQSRACYSSPADDGGAGGTAEVTLTEADEAEVASAAAAVAASGLTPGMMNLQLVGHVDDPDQHLHVAQGISHCTSNFATAVADLHDVSSDEFQKHASLAFSDARLTIDSVRGLFSTARVKGKPDKTTAKKTKKGNAYKIPYITPTRVAACLGAELPPPCEAKEDEDVEDEAEPAVQYKTSPKKVKKKKKKGEDEEDEDAPPKKKYKVDASSGTPWEMCFAGNLDALRASTWVCASTVNYAHAERGTTLLYTACRFGHDDVARWLLEEVGADPNVANTSAGAGSSPLHGAAYAGHHALVELLLNAGASVAATNKHGDTPLDDAKACTSAAAAKKCQKLLETHKPKPIVVEVEQTPTSVLVQLLKKTHKMDEASLKEAFLRAYHTMMPIIRTTVVPDLHEVMRQRKRMEAHRAAKETLGSQIKDGVSVSWQATDVNLTEEHPTFFGPDVNDRFTWGGPHVVATAMLVVSAENVTTPSATFFEAYPAAWTNKGANNHKVFESLGFGYGPTARISGELGLSPGLLAVWDRHTYHTFSPVHLKDTSKPGRITLLYLFVNDPNTPHTNTDTFPDQSQWTAREDALRNSREMHSPNGRRRGVLGWSSQRHGNPNSAPICFV